MYIDELNRSLDSTLKLSQKILKKRIISLKKRNIPDRFRSLLTIFDQCNIGMVNGHLSTPGKVLSAFQIEMECLRISLRYYHYDKKHDREMLKNACLIYRTRKYAK